MIDGTRLSDLNANNALLTFVHELGHLIGLAHEERNDQRKIWNATLYDSNSIMKTGVLSLQSITAFDCRAIHFYDNGFGHPVSCTLHRKKGRLHPCSCRLCLPNLLGKRVGGHDELIQVRKRRNMP